MERLSAARRRVPIAIALTLAALPARAHGESCLYAFSLFFYGVPAAAMLLIRWHRLRARVVATSVLVTGAVVLWKLILPRLDIERLSGAASWMLFLTPTLIALGVAIVLRSAWPARATLA